MESVDAVSENVKKNRPGPCDAISQDLPKIYRSSLLYSAFQSGTIVAVVLGVVDGLVWAGKEGLATGFDRLKCGDPLSVATGTVAGAFHGGMCGAVHGGFEGFRLPIYLLLGKPMRNALQKRDACAAKQVMQNCSDRMKKDIPNEKDEESRQQMERTARLIDRRLQEYKPARECPCPIEDIRTALQIAIFFSEFMGGLGVGVVISNAGGLVGGAKEGLQTARDRLCCGKIDSVATGTIAGVLHGAADKGFKQFFRGLEIPLTFTKTYDSDCVKEC